MTSAVKTNLGENKEFFVQGGGELSINFGYYTSSFFQKI
jgi:hypothetical protein